MTINRTNNLKKILIIRFSSIGDIVLTTPVVRCLKEQLDCHVHFLTKRCFASVLENNPFIDKIWTIEKNTKEISPHLKKEKFDYIVDLHKNLRSNIVKRLLGVPAFSFNKLNTAKWLMVHTKINRLPNIHIVDRYLATVSPLGVKNDEKGLDFFISNSHHKEAEQFLEKNNLQQTRFLAVVIGAAHNTKIPTNNFYNSVLKNLNIPTVLIGGKKEMERGADFSRISTYIYNSAGQFSIGGSAALMKKAVAVLTPDTGMMHIAAALNKNIISIWGNTIPAFGMTPYYPKNTTAKSIIIENNDLKCRPCSKIGYNSCPRKHFHCMALLEPKIVIQTIKTMLI